jgi:elongator complex protein 3
MTKSIAELIADYLLANPPTSAKEIGQINRQIAKQAQQNIPPASAVIAVLKKHRDQAASEPLIRLLRKRAVRTLSGVAPVAVLVKPYPCPGRCAFCPTELAVPKSYLPNEPAVMRAIRCNYDPSAQVKYRIKALEANGHHPEKIELIVIGGTWSYLPDNYKYWFIASCFFAANHYGRQTKKQALTEEASLAELRAWLAKEQLTNEKARYRLIGITLETRPDYINNQELQQMRELGATRIELGVQAIDDAILKHNLRESTIADIQRATALALNYGFKLTYHFMPGLPGSSAEHDINMYRQMFSQPEELSVLTTEAEAKINQRDIDYILQSDLTDNPYNPDQIKFYPTVVTQGSLLYRWWEQGKYQAYSDETLGNIILACKKATPPWVRIVRLVRDIPAESIVAGSKLTNFRQILQDKGAVCRCIRCREAQKTTANLVETNLLMRKYRHAEGDDYFISFESKDDKTIYGFVRLRLATAATPELAPTTAFIRELHVYGELARIGASGQVQHIGLGKKLMAIAEKLATSANFSHLAVIAGVGVRGYYRQLGYSRQGSYMVKKI